jgi:hypothetical protein
MGRRTITKHAKQQRGTIVSDRGWAIERNGKEEGEREGGTDRRTDRLMETIIAQTLCRLACACLIRFQMIVDCRRGGNNKGSATLRQGEKGMDARVTGGISPMTKHSDGKRFNSQQSLCQLVIESSRSWSNPLGSPVTRLVPPLRPSSTSSSSSTP